MRGAVRGRERLFWSISARSANCSDDGFATPAPRAASPPGAKLRCFPRMEDAMTYCVGVKLKSGLVFASDSRTNAGMDNVARFSKMRVFCRDGDRVIVTLSAGNLSLTQNTLSTLDLATRNDPQALGIWTATSMFEVARLIGDTIREVKERDEKYLHAENIDASASFIVGGQIKGEKPRLFLVYSEGNCIESSDDTPFMQIGEIKYGKPVFDRIISRDTSIADAVKCTIVSFDSTMRSNLSVGAPIDLLVYEEDALNVKIQRRLDDNDAYLATIRNDWEKGLRSAFDALPSSPWL
jgi:putative proteasome-type protease